MTKKFKKRFKKIKKMRVKVFVHFDQELYQNSSSDLTSFDDLSWPPNETKFESKIVLDHFLTVVNVPLKDSLSIANVWLESLKKI